MLRKTIMVADDDQDILDMLTTVLVFNGYHVFASFNGETLKQLGSEYMPDLLLLDIRMSGLNGVEECMRIKKQPETHNLPIVLISANHDLPEAAEAAGADGYVPKPFNVKQLLEVVKALIG